MGKMTINSSGAKVSTEKVPCNMRDAAMKKSSEKKSAKPFYACKKKFPEQAN